MALQRTRGRQCGDFKLGNKKKINQNVFAKMSIKRNYSNKNNSNKDSNVQVLRGHHNLNAISRPGGYEVFRIAGWVALQLELNQA